MNLSGLSGRSLDVSTALSGLFFGLFRKFEGFSQDFYKICQGLPQDYRVSP